MKISNMFALFAAAAFMANTLNGCSPKDLEDMIPDNSNATKNSAKGQAKYKRSYFGGAWTDKNDAELGHNGCSTRDDILSRDLKDVKKKGKCEVVSGILYNTYDKKKGYDVIKFTKGDGNQVDIDHKIPLKLAWAMGANKWNDQKRTKFANDPLNLIAVDYSSNRQKGDKGPSAWMPPNKDYYCTYVKNFETVASEYDLEILPADAKKVSSVKKQYC